MQDIYSTNLHHDPNYEHSSIAPKNEWDGLPEDVKEQKIKNKEI
jgi:hypothetical protein